LNHFVTSFFGSAVFDPQDEIGVEDDDGAALSGATGNPAICDL